MSAVIFRKASAVERGDSAAPTGTASVSIEINEGILRASPQNADALHLLGVVAYQTKNYQAADDLIGKTLTPHISLRTVATNTTQIEG